jgi:hypothetical protein
MASLTYDSSGGWGYSGHSLVWTSSANDTGSSSLHLRFSGIRARIAGWIEPSSCCFNHSVDGTTANSCLTNVVDEILFDSSILPQRSHNIHLFDFASCSSMTLDLVNIWSDATGEPALLSLSQGSHDGSFSIPRPTSPPSSTASHAPRTTNSSLSVEELASVTDVLRESSPISQTATRETTHTSISSSHRMITAIAAALIVVLVLSLLLTLACVSARRSRVKRNANGPLGEITDSSEKVSHGTWKKGRLSTLVPWVKHPQSSDRHRKIQKHPLGRVCKRARVVIKGFSERVDLKISLMIADFSLLTAQAGLLALFLTRRSEHFLSV